MKGVFVETGRDDQTEADNDSEQEEDEEIAYLIVKSAAVEVGLANQRFKNAVDSRAFQHQAKERVIGRGNNLLGTIPVLGRGGIHSVAR
ncbi:hypothetical protein U1Q18_032651 [Sarracenia purpurea var. burkii]